MMLRCLLAFLVRFGDGGESLSWGSVLAFWQSALTKWLWYASVLAHIEAVMLKTARVLGGFGRKVLQRKEVLWRYDGPSLHLKRAPEPLDRLWQEKCSILWHDSYSLLTKYAWSHCYGWQNWKCCMRNTFDRQMASMYATWQSSPHMFICPEYSFVNWSLAVCLHTCEYYS